MRFPLFRRLFFAAPALLLSGVPSFAQEIAPRAQSTPFVRPLTVPSNESNEKQLVLAQAEGAATVGALDTILHEAPASRRGELYAGAYHVAYAITPPEGSYELRTGRLVWSEPNPAAAGHLRVFVLDGAQQRLVTELTVQATIRTSAGTRTLELPYGHYPLLDAYGANIELPPDGSFALQVDIAPAAMRRHDPNNGDRFSKPVTVRFAPGRVDAGVRVARAASSGEENDLTVARAIGSAIDKEIAEMKQQANDLQQTERDGYRIASAVEYAEAWWHFDGRQFTYTSNNEVSGRQNAHVEVAVMDAATGRFLPVLHVRQAVVEEGGRTVADTTVPFMWHPWLYHYGENVRVPRSARYRFVVSFDPPAYRRYGRLSGNAFSTSQRVAFDKMNVMTGEK